MWIKLNESRSIITNEETDYQKQMNEAFTELRNSLANKGIFTEADNKMLNWVQQKVAKLVPSPEKLKDFFSGLGAKIDKKIQGCGSDTFIKAWNNLKEMVMSQDNEEISPEEAGLATPSDGGQEGGETDAVNAEGEPQDGNNEGGNEEAGEEGNTEEGQQEENQEQMAAESLYEEGFFDAFKDGWKAMKKGWNKPTKKAPAKRGSTKNSVAKKGKGGTSKATAKKGGKKAKKGQAKNKILQFLKDHWKAIVITLVVAVGIYFVGTAALGWFGGAKAAGKAVNTLAKPGFRLPMGMKALPKGAKLIANGVVKYANGSILASGDSIDPDDLNF